MLTEDQLEQQCLEWFREGGWACAHGPDISPDGASPERADYREMILTGRLLGAMQRLNPHLPVSALEEAVSFVCKLDHPILEQRNRAFHRLLLDGMPVAYRESDEGRHDTARLINFSSVAHNEFLVVNQVAVKGPTHVRRPDILVFINGLPLAVIELKNPADEQADIWKAYQQLQTYKEDIARREHTKGMWAALEKLVGAAPRLEEVAADLVEHFEARTAVIEGKAMIVCMSRDICARLYNAIVALRPDWHGDDIAAQIQVPARRTGRSREPRSRTGRSAGQ